MHFVVTLFYVLPPPPPPFFPLLLLPFFSSSPTLSRAHTRTHVLSLLSLTLSYSRLFLFLRSTTVPPLPPTHTHTINGRYPSGHTRSEKVLLLLSPFGFAPPFFSCTFAIPRLPRYLKAHLRSLNVERMCRERTLFLPTTVVGLPRRTFNLTEHRGRTMRESVKNFFFSRSSGADFLRKKKQLMREREILVRLFQVGRG